MEIWQCVNILSLTVDEQNYFVNTKIGQKYVNIHEKAFCLSNAEQKVDKMIKIDQNDDSYVG